MKINYGNFESNLLFLKKTGMLSKNAKILEIGSGKGNMLRYLKNEGCQVTGIDANKEYIDFGKKELGVEITMMSGDQLEFNDNSFDIVMSFDVLEHIPNSDKHLEEVRRVLKPGGYYLLQTPNKWLNIPFEIVHQKSLTKYKTYHCSLHNFWEIKKRFRKHNFETSFVDIPVVNDFFKQKIKKFFGHAGLLLIRIINPDKLPTFLKTNFYIVAKLKQ